MSPLASLVLFVYDFGQVSSSCCVSHNIILLHFGPKLRAVFITFFSFEFIPSFFILLHGTICLVWLGFALQKCCLCIYHNIEIQIGFQLCVTQIITITTRNLSSNPQSCKGSCHPGYNCVYNS